MRPYDHASSNMVITPFSFLGDDVVSHRYHMIAYFFRITLIFAFSALSQRIDFFYYPRLFTRSLAAYPQDAKRRQVCGVQQKGQDGMVHLRRTYCSPHACVTLPRQHVVTRLAGIKGSSQRRKKRRASGICLEGLLRRSQTRPCYIIDSNVL